MALTKNIQVNAFGQNIVVPNAYIKVNFVKGTKLEVSCSVITYAEDKTDIVKEQLFSFVPDLTGANFIKQAYGYLKSLPEFSDAKDC